MPKSWYKVHEHNLPMTPVDHQVFVQCRNVLMKNGHQHKADRIVLQALQRIKLLHMGNPWSIVWRAIRNVRPLITVKSMKFSGKTYMVPIPVPKEKQLALAVKWLVQSCILRPERSIIDRFSNELVDASIKQGNSVQKRLGIYKLASTNQAFIQFRR